MTTNNLPPLCDRTLDEADITDTLGIIRHCLGLGELEILDILEPLTRAQKVQIWQRLLPSEAAAMKHLKVVRDTTPDEDGLTWV